MNCPEARDQLAAWLYGDLTPDEAAAIEAHVKSCPACQEEQTALARVRQALDSLPAPVVSVEVHRIYWAEARRQQQRTRRWRRAALGAAAAAAAFIVLAAGLRLEVGVGAHQVTLRWGTPHEPAPPRPFPRPAVSAPESSSFVQLKEQVQVLSELVQGLREDADARDQRRQEALVRLQGQLDEMHRQAAWRWDVTEADLAALSARSSQPQKGTLP